MPIKTPLSRLYDRGPARLAVYEGLKKSPDWNPKSLSLTLERNHAYIRQYLVEGRPDYLPEEDRKEVAKLLKINEGVLRPPPRPRRSRQVSQKLTEPPTFSSVGGSRGIPPDGTAEIDVTAGLGGGGLSMVTQRTDNGVSYAAEEIRDYWRLPEWLLGTWSNARAQHIVCFPAQGDSMAPTIQSGDVVFADLRHRVPSPPGIYVLADAFGGVVTKRLEVVSKSDEDPVKVRVSSDNPMHETRIWTLDEINIIGRYVGRFTAF